MTGLVTPSNLVYTQSGALNSRAHNRPFCNQPGNIVYLATLPTLFLG